MPTTRSYFRRRSLGDDSKPKTPSKPTTTMGYFRRRSLGDDSKPTTPRKRVKMVSNELARKLEEGTVAVLRRSLRMKYKKLGLKLDEVAEYAHDFKKLGLKLDEEIVPLPKRPRRKYKEEDSKRAAFKKMWRPPARLRSIYLPPKLLAEFALWDYNKKHGTDLEYVRLLKDKQMPLFVGPGLDVDFVEGHYCWNHINFEARLRNNADPKPFVLFAELYPFDDKYILTTLSLVKPTDEKQGCPRCWSCVSHPPHGFRAGFDKEGSRTAWEPKELSIQEADNLAEFAIQDHNEKHGSDMKFVRTLGCNSFTCAGLVMDFSTKNASWVHMNFEARVGPKEVVTVLFAELYLGDDNKFVLATLSVAEPSDKTIHGNWKERINIERGCLYCPERIRHPWRGFNFAYNYPPWKKPSQ